MNRREFISRLGSAAVAWPRMASAQGRDRERRIGVLLQGAENDVAIQTSIEELKKSLNQLGWTEGKNVGFDYRWSRSNAVRAVDFAKELIKLPLDLIVAQGTISARALHQQASAIPVVFVQVTNPVGQGFVASLAEPGGNITGFAMYEPEIASKWVEILKEVAPGITRIAVLFNPETVPGGGTFFVRAIEGASALFSVNSSVTAFRTTADIEQTFYEMSKQTNVGLIVPPDSSAYLHRELIIASAARVRIPAIYSQRFMVQIGGLMCYGVDAIEQFRQTASYVDRVLRGAKPSELPIQVPTKFELVINRKAANALGLEFPPNLLFTADEVIE